MNSRRRMMLLAEGPLIVFKEGNSALTKGSFEDGSGNEIENGVISIGVAGTGFCNIKGINFTKYKTLYIEHKGTGFVGYGTSTEPSKSACTDYKEGTSRRTLRNFDISAVSGSNYYIKIGGGFSMEVYNIWLE